MMQVSYRAAIAEAAAYIKSRTSIEPQVVIVTGSGLSALADQASNAVSIPYSDIPGFPTSTVQGHPGELVLGRLEDRSVAILRGRVHFYEGAPLPQVTFPLRVLHALGASTLIVTNAAGGVNESFQPGDIMLIADHIGLPAMAGNNPLFGPNDTFLGPRFPVMAGAYDRGLRQLAQAAAAENGFTLQEGVYAWVAGPSFETPAEIRFLRIVGADAVGMSTVPEVIVARHGGMRVLGLSGISNKANLDGSTVTTHEEVIEAGKVITPKIEKIVRGVLRSL